MRTVEEGGLGCPTFKASSASFLGHWVISMTWATRPSSRRGPITRFGSLAARGSPAGEVERDDGYCGAKKVVVSSACLEGPVVEAMIPQFRLYTDST